MPQDHQKYLEWNSDRFRKWANQIGPNTYEVVNESESKNLFELIHKRRKKSSTIFCSQFREEGWYDRLGGDDNPLADAIMDRIIYDAYKINIESIDPSKDISMREVYGIDQNMIQ